ncbi:MAG: menaquinone reductase molybdopterin-binding-like subunit QrcB [Thermodesulfobacteriota bacterium]
MKMDRRSFLSFVIGGAAGINLSPLPWKLTDDLAIWSQNWPWTPVPKDGEVTHVNSTCFLCPGGCGITVRKVEDRAVKIEGMKGHPVNDGSICILGLAGLQFLYGPSRVRTPLRRVGERGENKWEKISWEDALAEVAKNLSDLRSKNLSHTVACISGYSGGTVPGLFERFLTVYGSPNFVRTPSVKDSYELGLHLMAGVQADAGFDFENADYILSFGCGIIEGWGSPVRMFKANSRWKENGVKVVQLEPRLSNTAAKSDQWIAVTPGTEGVLALGLARVIVDESLYRREFISGYTTGFNELIQNVLKDYPPEQVSKITGVDKTTLVSLARAFASAKKPLAICGRGKGAVPESAGEVMAVLALNALVGNINQKGGVWSVPGPLSIRWPEPEMDAQAAGGMQKARIDGAGGKKYPHIRSLLHRVPDAVNSAEASPLQTLFVLESNPYYSLSDSGFVKKAWQKIPFVVSFSSYLDETAQNSDLILPNHTYLERKEDIPGVEGFHKPIVNLMKPVVTPQFNTMHAGDVIIRLAKKLGDPIGKAFPWEDTEACMEELFGDKWEELEEKGYWFNGNFEPPPLNKSFETASRKFEFMGEGFGAFYKEVIVKAPGEEAAYPLVLIPYDTPRIAGGRIANAPFLTKTVPDTVIKGKDGFVEVNPKTALSYGLSEGRYALLSTPKGSARVRVHLFEGIMPGVVAMPTGLGHAGYDTYLSGKGVNVNELMGPVEDSASGLNAAWGIRAKLSKA